MIFVYVLTAFLAGVTVVVARIINANLADEIGLFEGTFYNYVVGLLGSMLLLLLINRNLNIPNINFSAIPFWAYLGGMVGVAVVSLSSYVTPRISAFYMTLFMFIGQLFIGMVLDFSMLNQFSIGKLIGGLLVLAGLTYNLSVDNKEEASQCEC